MRHSVHGTKRSRDKQHPVFDARLWQRVFPLGRRRAEGGWVSDPESLTHAEQGRKLARSKGLLGPSVPADVFVWADSKPRDKPWLTRIGGNPWRERYKPWPKSKAGEPLTFLGQICFVDSHDVLPCKLPGEVALIFGTNNCGWVSTVDGCALEWCPLKLKDHDYLGWNAPRGGTLPYEFHGVIHRTVQYVDSRKHEPAFRAAGYKDGGWHVGSIQATSVGTYANLPQGWPFEKGDGYMLIATLSSFYFGGRWPLCDVPAAAARAETDGERSGMWNNKALDFGVGDAGCIWIYRDKDGRFKLGEACG